ncbi:hypothetical protein [Spirosoma aerophilum]
MPNQQPRDVTGGEAVWGSMFPGLGLINYVWGVATVPMEVFLRRGFGERYFTQANFFGGLVLLLLIQIISYLVGLLNPLNYVWMFFGRGGASVDSMLGPITKWYVIIGMLHFLGIWWRNIIGTPVHTFSAGKSWLRPIGIIVMFVLNLFLDNIVRLIFALSPRLDKRRLDFALPVLSDVDTFTEKWIEPAFIAFISLFAAAVGQTTVFLWLLMSAAAMNMYTGLRHQQERGYWLNIQDSMIEAEYYNQSKNAERAAMKRANDRMMRKTAYEVKQNPELVKVIERNNPTLADAMRAVQGEPKADASTSV